MFNIPQMMKQAQEMQHKMQEMQEKLAGVTFEGKAGGELVKFTVNGKGEAVKLEIDATLLKPEDKATLEDLIVAAFNDAKLKAEENSKSSMSNMFGGLGLPADFKLPF